MILFYKWLRFNLKNVYIILIKYYKLFLIVKMLSNVLLREYVIMNVYKF